MPSEKHPEWESQILLNEQNFQSGVLCHHFPGIIYVASAYSGCWNIR